MMQTVGAQGYYPQPMQTTPSASAVNIQIFEPKAYAAPMQAPQVQYPMYAYPQQSMYAQPYVNQYQQYMMPQQTMYAPVPQYQPQAYMPQQQYQQPQPEAAQLPQQQMPAPVLTQPAETPVQAPEQAPAAQAPEQAPVQEAQAQAPALQVEQPAQTQQSAVDVNALISGLQSTDNKTQEDAITKIANYSQGDPEMQNAVLNESIMQGLANIVKQDTSGLQGPSEAQNAAINKAASGAKLTPEEEQLAGQLAPKTLADKNRVISMFTLAMLQKNQRDEVDRYNETQDPANKLPQLKINDLIGYNEIENAARNENEKEVKLAAIQALSYAARPEDKETLEPVLTAALQDSEPLIQQAATEVLTNLGSTAAPAQGAQEQPQEVDLSKMSKKERKAYEKAQKKAAKEMAKNPGQQAQKAA